MDWHPAYKYIIIAVGIPIIKSFQRTIAKKHKLNNNVDNDSSTITNINNDLEGSIPMELKVSVNEAILKLIEEKGYILLEQSLSENLDYEIGFANHEKKSKWDFKYEPTFITLKGNDKSKEVNCTTWSDRYEFGQNSRNNRIAQEFLNELTERLT